MIGAAPATLEALRLRLDHWLPGIRVEHVAETGSTSSDLLERARIDTLSARPQDVRSDPLSQVRSSASSHLVQVRRSIESAAFSRCPPQPLGPASSAPGQRPFLPCLRLADRQTVGRGRHGRQWQSAPGRSLTFSLALRLAAADWSGLSLAVGVAIADALDPLRDAGRQPVVPDATTRMRIGLKWPNDLWLVDSDSTGERASRPSGRSGPSGHSHPSSASSRPGLSGARAASSAAFSSKRCRTLPSASQ